MTYSAVPQCHRLLSMADFVPVPSPMDHLQPGALVQIVKERLGDLMKNTQGLVVLLQERVPVMVQELASLVKEDLQKGQAESILVRVVFYISSFVMLLTILQTRWFRWIWNFESDYKKKCKRANEIKEIEKKKQGQNEEEDEFAKIHYSLKSDLQHCVQIRIEAVKIKIAAQKKKLQVGLKMMRNFFLAAMSSSTRLVVCPSVGLSVGIPL